MTAIIWNISQLDVKPQEGDLTDVVITAHWQCNGTQEINGKTYSGSVYSTSSFTQPEGDFTPYDELTQDQVLGWIWVSGVDKEATESAVESQIANQINPPIIQPPLPWSKP